MPITGRSWVPLSEWCKKSLSRSRIGRAAASRLAEETWPAQRRLRTPIALLGQAVAEPIDMKTKLFMSNLSGKISIDRVRHQNRFDIVRVQRGRPDRCGDHAGELLLSAIRRIPAADKFGTDFIGARKISGFKILPRPERAQHWCRPRKSASRPGRGRYLGASSSRGNRRMLRFVRW